MLDTLFSAADAAGEALLKRDRRGDVAAYSGEPTTPADVVSERIIRARLASAFPDIPYYQKGQPVEGRTFIVDPIDGTGNYLMGDPFWGVSIALVEDGRTVKGVVGLPRFNEGFWSEAGGGHSTSLRLTSTPKLQGAHVWFDQNWFVGDSGVEILRRLLSAQAIPQIRRCCVGGLMWVASGRIDGFIHTSPQPQDIAAAALIVEAAGGRVTDLQGNPWNPFSPSIVASNGLIHDELLSRLA